MEGSLSERIRSCCREERDKILTEEYQNAGQDISENAFESPEVEVPIEKQHEVPEMVQLSPFLQLEPDEDQNLHKLKIKWLFPEDTMHFANKNSETFDIELGVMNSDTENLTKWPVYSKLVLLGPQQSELIKCTCTIKEIQPGIMVKLIASVKTPKDVEDEIYQFQMIDKFGKKFGEP